MEEEFSDLVPLFVEESRERLDRLALCVPRLAEAPQAVVQAAAGGGGVSGGAVGAGAVSTGASGAGAAGGGAPGAGAAGAGAVGDIRVDSQVLDSVAERATEVRILALAARPVAERLHELARLAEEGVREPQPGQVLAVLATNLRRPPG